MTKHFTTPGQTEVRFSKIGNIEVILVTPGSRLYPDVMESGLVTHRRIIGTDQDTVQYGGVIWMTEAFVRQFTPKELLYILFTNARWLESPSTAHEDHATAVRAIGRLSYVKLFSKTVDRLSRMIDQPYWTTLAASITMRPFHNLIRSAW